MADNIYTRYFVFSNTQMQRMIDLQKQRGGIAPKFGTVLVNGVPKVYTDIVVSTSKLRYADSKIVTSGDIRTIKYTKSNIR